MNFLFALLLVSSPARPRIIEGVAVVVGSQIILASDISQKMQPHLPQVCQVPSREEQARLLEDLWRGAMEDEISNVLMELEAQKHNVYIDASEINATVELIISQNPNMESIADLQERLAAQNYPFLLWRKDLRRQLLRQRLMHEVVKLHVSVEEQAIRSYYQQKLREINAEEKVTVRELFIPGKEADTGTLATIDKAIAARTPFVDLVEKYSRARSVALDGMHEDVVPGSYPPAVDRLLFPSSGKAPEAGVILGPVKTPAGVWYLEVLERVEAGYLPYEQVREKMKEELSARLLQQKGTEWIRALQDRYLVDRQMVKPPRNDYCRRGT